MIYTVIVNSEGAQPADIPTGALKEGDSAWFWMKDTTENATLVIELEKDGAKVRSPVLQFACELDDNGTRIDENCMTRYDFVFNQHTSAGEWNFTFMTYVNDSLNKTSTGSVYIQEDVHLEDVAHLTDSLGLRRWGHGGTQSASLVRPLMARPS